MHKLRRFLKISKLAVLRHLHQGKSQRQGETPQWKKVEIFIPILVSITTLIFGITQYLDKRALEKQVAELDFKNKQIENLQKEAEIRNSIEVRYVSARLLDIYILLKQGTPEDGIRVTKKIDGDKTDSAFLEWLKKLEFYGGKDWGELTFLQTKPYEHFRANMNQPAVQKSRLALFLVRNTGKYSVSQMKIDYQLHPDNKNSQIDIGTLSPGKGMIFVTSVDNLETDLSNGAKVLLGETITYFDDFRQTPRTMRIRHPYESPRYEAPGFIWKS